MPTTDQEKISYLIALLETQNRAFRRTCVAVHNAYLGIAGRHHGMFDNCTDNLCVKARQLLTNVDEAVERNR